MATFNEIINSDKLVLVDFYAEWCGPCKTMAPILKELANNLDGSVNILKVDVDKNQKAAQTFKIKGVPTLILFKKGQIKWRQSGVVPVNELKKVIDLNS